MVLDPAYSERGTSDFKVAVVIAIDYKNNRYVVDRFRTKAAENDYINGSLNMFLRYKNRITYFGMPKGREVDFYNKVLELATSRRVFLPHIEIKNVSKSVTGVSERNKKARITMTLQALFQQGKYYLQETHQDIVDELLHHPYGKHDDLIDAMTGAEQILMPVYFEVEEKSEFAPSIKIERGDSGYGI
jgi:predicted phage terminase large subunit-like protein